MKNGDETMTHVNLAMKHGELAVNTCKLTMNKQYFAVKNGNLTMKHGEVCMNMVM